MPGGESRTFAEFPARNKDTGAAEALRISSWDANGRISAQLRMFVLSGWHKNPRPDDYKADKQRGVSIREGDLDAAIAALQQIRYEVHRQGRRTDGGDGSAPSDAASRPESPPPAPPAPPRSEPARDRQRPPARARQYEDRPLLRERPAVTVPADPDDDTPF